MTAPSTFPAHLELAALPTWMKASGQQWVVAGADKVPLNPSTGRNASPTDRSTWGTFVQARGRADRDGLHIGLVLTGGKLVCIDIDNCISEGGELSAEAAAIVAELNSYTEVSRSGRGLHILLEAELPTGRRRFPGGIEIYNRDRYIILTGDIRPGWGKKEVMNRLEQFTAFYARLSAAADPPQLPRPTASPQALEADDATILERCRRMAGFSPLYDRGDLSAYGNDHSSADLGLVNYFVVAGATDPDQLDRLFRTSALYRNKWDRTDYRDRTIGRALDGQVVPFAGWQQNQERPEIRMVTPTLQDAASNAAVDECADVRDELARLRAEKAALARQLAERDEQLAAVRRRADTAQRELTELRLLQSATMTMLRSREMRPGEKVLGLVALFEAEAARQRGTTDLDGWSDAPLARLAEAGGCSTDTAGRHLNTIASTGVVETRTINRRDTATGEIRKHRQVRLATVPEHEPAPNLSTRIIALSTARPERDPDDQGWGGKRTCPDCGNVGTITTTTVSCASCGQVLSTTSTVQAPEPEDRPTPPMPQLAVTKNRGSNVVPMPQLAGSEIVARRARAAEDLASRGEVATAPWDPPPPEPESPPTLFPLDDLAPPSSSHHWAGD
jgi:hypothetical protein